MKQKRYIVTNNCYWYDKSKKTRSPHYIEVCDMNTGEIKQLKNGTIISIIKAVV